MRATARALGEGRDSEQERRCVALAQALAHPIRIRILHALSEAPGPLSPARLVPLVDQSLGGVSYHVRHLVAGGLLELVGERMRRGAIEHEYELSTDAHALVRSVLVAIERIAKLHGEGTPRP